jgi:hypothetical protein
MHRAGARSATRADGRWFAQLRAPFYPVAVQRPEIDDFLQRSAPDDVRATIVWLSASGYTLSSHRGESTFGAQFVYAGQAEVLITVDRSQWMLDVAPRPGAQAWQYDVLIAAQSGQPYGEVFPETGSRSPGDPLPDQLPEGVSWRETLPGILQWVDGEGVSAAVERALRERHRLM